MILLILFITPIIISLHTIFFGIFMEWCFDKYDIMKKCFKNHSISVYKKSSVTRSSGPTVIRRSIIFSGKEEIDMKEDMVMICLRILLWRLGFPSLHMKWSTRWIHWMVKHHSVGVWFSRHNLEEIRLSLVGSCEETTKTCKKIKGRYVGKDKEINEEQLSASESPTWNFLREA